MIQMQVVLMEQHTSSNFTLGGADAVNKNDSDHIAYVFAEKKATLK